MNKQIPHVLTLIKNIENTFKRDDEIDSAALKNFAEIIKSEPQSYSKEEEEMIERGKGECCTH